MRSGPNKYVLQGKRKDDFAESLLASAKEEVEVVDDPDLALALRSAAEDIRKHKTVFLTHLDGCAMEEFDIPLADIPLASMLRHWSGRSTMMTLVRIPFIYSFCKNSIKR